MLFMLNKNRNIQNFVTDILEKILRINSILENISYDVFSKDKDKKELISYNIIIIGEALTNIEIDFLLKYNADKIYWRNIKDTRNILVHEYALSRDGKLYRIAVEQIPILQKYIEQMLDDLEFEIK